MSCAECSRLIEAAVEHGHRLERVGPAERLVDVGEAMVLYRAGWTLAAIGERYGVTRQAIFASMRRAGMPPRRTLPRPARLCSVSGCDATHHCRGWCVRHFKQWQRIASAGAGVVSVLSVGDRVQVTAEDIEQGVRGAAFACPIALALTRVTGLSPTVGNRARLFHGDGPDPVAVLPLALGVRMWMVTYDEGYPVGAITLVVTPDGTLDIAEQAS